MRPIHLAQLDKTRPALVLTRQIARSQLTNVTVAPITSRIRGVSTEILVGAVNGLAQQSVISVDNIITIPVSHLGRQIGFFHDAQECELYDAIRFAFQLFNGAKP